MSVMGNEQVGLDFNVGGNFSASLNQMIAQTDQYSRAADGLVGHINHLNVITTALIGKTTALTGANTAATAQAAAYQQAMSGLAANAAAAGTNFAKTEASVMSLARQYGSLGTAVQAMTAVKQSGVMASTSATQVENLADAFIKLDKANGTMGSQLGSQLMMMGNQFGNGQNSLLKYGDTLTSLSAKYGASAQSALGFAQSLSPVAASVGVSEGAVIGLGTAAARMGQDGFASGTAFNKVLLDMSYALRNGGPQLKTYADMMGTTSKSLAALFQKDPTEVMLKFTEAVGNGGPQAQRYLEALGLDATRTVKALTALSSQGNLRQIVDQAAAEYGSGSTTKAAEEALGGINDQMAKLQETMSQTVAAAGKPFLGWLSSVLGLANSAGDAVNKLANNSQIQGLAHIMAPVGMAAGAGMSFVSNMGMVAMGAGVLRMVGRSGFGQGFGGGRALGMAGEMLPAEANLAANMGYGWGTFRGGVGGPTMMDRVRAGGRAAAGIGTLGANMYSSQMLFGMGQPGLVTAEGSALRAAGAGAWGELKGGQPIAAARTAGGGFFGYMGTLLRNQAPMGAMLTAEAMRPPMGPLPKPPAAMMGLPVAAGMPATAGIGAAVQAGIHESMGPLRKFGTSISETDGAMMRFSKTSSLAASNLGQFVKATGQAVMPSGIGSSMMGGLKAMGPMLAITGGITAFEMWQKHNDDQAAKHEIGQSGFNDAWSSYNDFAAKVGEAGKGAATLGDQLQKSAKDVSASADTMTKAFQLTTEQANTALTPGYKVAFTPSDASNVDRTAVEARGMLGANARPQDINRVLMDVLAQGGNWEGVADKLKQVNRSGNVYADYMKTYGEERGFIPSWQTDAQANTEKDITSEATRSVFSVAQQYGIAAPATQGAKLTEAAKMWQAGVVNEPYYANQEMMAGDVGKVLNMSPDDIDKMKEASAGGQGFEAALKEVGGQAWDNYQKMQAQGFDINKGNYAVLGATPEAQNAGRQADAAIQQATGHISSLGQAATSAATAAKQFGVDISQVTPGQIAAVTGQPGYTGWAINQAVNNPSDVNAQQTAENASLATATTQAGGNVLSGQAALLKAAMAAPVGPARNAIMAAVTQGDTANITRQAGQGMMANTADAIKAGQDARAMGPLEDPAAEQKRRQLMAGEQQAYATREGFMKSYLTAEHNMDIQLTRQDEDAARSRYQSWRDYNTQVENATADFHKSQFRAQRDYNISLQRMVEDAAKSIYDPYQRLSAQSVWDTRSLLANLAEQNAAITKQRNQVAQLQKMGLSQQTVDTLDLGNAKNRDQVDRMLSEAFADPRLIQQLNAAAATRGATTKATVQSGNNVEFRRAAADFKKQLADAGTDFETAMSRAETAHNNALDDMEYGLNQSKKRAHEDLANMGWEVSGTYTQIAAKFLKDTAALPLSAKAAMSQNLRTMITDAATDANAALDTALAPFGLSAKAFQALMAGTQATPFGTRRYIGSELKAWNGVQWVSPNDPSMQVGAHDGLGSGGTGVYSGAVTGAMPPAGITSEPQSLPRSPAQAVAWDAKMSHNNTFTTANHCDHYVGAAYGLDSSGYENANAHWRGIPPKYKAKSGTPPAGALVFFYGGKDGHATVSAGGGWVWSTDFKRQNRIDAVKITDIARGWGNLQYVGWSVPYFGGRMAPLAHATVGTQPGRNPNNQPGHAWLDGGIALKPHVGLVAEGGVGEAMIPLNARGANVLAQAMVQYVDSSKVKAATVSRYATPVANYSYVYDQRTQITGPVTVQASDPQAMANALAAKARSDRLVRTTR